jgi:catechol 2,3-dioxygenase-like lactoylglutathione lyase family enzyme
MKILKQIVVFDTGDLAAESAFWAGFLDGTVETEEDWHTLYVDGVQTLDFQYVEDHVRPDWPDGQPQQLHLDLYVDDIRAAEEKALSLGATLLRPAGELDADEGFRVYADPSGHPFCLCWNTAPSA